MLTRMWKNQSPHIFCLECKIDSHFRKDLAVPQNAKHRVTTCSSNFSPTYILKKIINVCLHKNLYRNVLNSLMNNYQEVERTQCMSTDE